MVVILVDQRCQDASLESAKYTASVCEGGVPSKKDVVKGLKTILVGCQSMALQTSRTHLPLGIRT